MGRKTLQIEETEVRCKYLERCPDTIKLKESVKKGHANEDLADQHHELCLSASPETCSIYQTFDNQYKDKRINI